MEAPGRFQFLRVNKFFELTPFTGFSFIQAAKTIKETVLWYLVILLFTIITIFNVHSTIINYLSRPTKTYVQAASSTRNSSIGNLSLVLNTSLSEFSILDPTKLSYGNLAGGLRVQYPMATTYLMCSMITEQGEEWDTEVMKYTMVEWVETLLSDWSKFKPSNNQESILHLSQRALTEWTDELDERAKELLDFLWDKDTFPLSWGLGSKRAEQVLAEAMPLINGPLRLKNKNTPYYLMLLEALKTDHDPRKKYFEVFEEYWLHIWNRIQKDLRHPTTLIDWNWQLDWVFNLPYATDGTQDLIEPGFKAQAAADFNKTAAEVLAELDISVLELLNAAYEGMSQVLRFTSTSTNGEPVAIWLEDWSYDTLVWEYGRDVYATAIDGWQSLRLKAQPSKDAQGIGVQLHSFPLMWHLKMINAFADYIDMHTVWNPKEKIEVCEDDRWESPFGVWHALKLLDDITSYYAEKTTLTLENEFGNGMEIEPFRSYLITLKPSGQLYSYTKNCYKNSYKYCMDECMSESYKDSCNCVSWQLFQHRGAAELCDRSCPAIEANSCLIKCEVSLEHPCAMSLYQLEYTSQRQSPLLNTYRPIFDFTIRKASVFNHPHFIEEYEMTPGMFFAQLGGVMEFWMGINVIGLLHFFVYMFKQLVNVNNPDTTTAQSIKRLAGNHQAVAPESEMSTSEELTETKLLQVLERNNQQLRGELLNEMRQMVQTNAKLEARKCFEEMKA